MTTIEQSTVRVTVTGCARCGGNHEQLEFSRFTHPPTDRNGVKWTHWAACPSNGQPVLLRMLVTPEIKPTGALDDAA